MLLNKTKYYDSWIIGNNLDFVPISSLAAVFSNGSLHLNTVTKEDEGMYKCNISNGIGTALVKTVVLRVIGETLWIF